MKMRIRTYPIIIKITEFISNEGKSLGKFENTPMLHSEETTRSN